MNNPYYFIENYIPFKKGRQTNLDGLKITANPYKCPSLEYDLFVDGWKSVKYEK
ncbi:MAG: hypothetical protein AABY22_14425 [Nanoarchaeota archaeon]